MARRIRRTPLLLLATLLAGPGCGDDPTDGPDASIHDASIYDASIHDASIYDASIHDASIHDASIHDASIHDASIHDASIHDASIYDASIYDASVYDASVDAGSVLPVRVRIVAANVTSGNYQAYEQPGRRILAALQPDITLVQEFNVGNNTPTELQAFVHDTFGPEFHYYREPGAQLPNGVVSRYPIIASGTWDDPKVTNREFAWARIDLPGSRDLWAVSVHLLTSSASNRNAEATALVEYIQAEVPASDLLVIGGDFNTPNQDESCITTLAAVVKVTAPYPTDHDENPNTNSGRTKPYDRVLADSDLAPMQAELTLGTSTFPTGLVFDTRVYTPLSDAPPAQAGDSAASNMQHMAVAKEFLIAN